MVWFCLHMLGMEGWPTTREILQVLCECAETTFPYLPKNEKRPLQAGGFQLDCQIEGAEQSLIATSQRLYTAASQRKAEP